MISNNCAMFMLLAASMVNLAHIALWLRGTSQKLPASTRREFSYRGHDHPQLVPLEEGIPTVLVAMEETVHYPPLGNRSDAEWLSMAMPAFGYVRLGPEDRTFSLSMFHELHCLRVINLAFARDQLSFINLGHMKHCLNYLRQSALCAPDLALEPGEFEKKDFDVERTHGVHECNDWETVFRFHTQDYKRWSKKTGYGMYTYFNSGA
ncbi:hypothetical protein GY45DRAFT_1261108 [Cubamyces sp. BRFM 1775]|nr:hypothetical protein GY45DRAFT_1261108 [Cubamyces sp. BRFM 1775]